MEVVNHIITEEEWERIEKDAHARLEAAQKEALEKEKEEAADEEEKSSEIYKPK